MNSYHWLLGGHFSYGAGAGFAYAEAPQYGIAYTEECKEAMREHLRLAAERHEIDMRQKRRTEFEMSEELTVNDNARCDTCGWYDEFTGVCCCADRSWCADFPLYPHDLCCRHWKNKEEVQYDAE